MENRWMGDIIAQSGEKGKGDLKFFGIADGYLS
jgi:hypothetical protein